MTKPTHTDIRYEASDIGSRPTLLIVAGTVVLVLFVLGAVWFLYQKQLEEARPPVAERAQFLFTDGPQWRSPIIQDREKLWAVERERLGETRWLDREAGILQIPVNDALRLAAENGLPQWEPVTVPPHSPYNLMQNDD